MSLIVLRTACGCESKPREWPDPLPPEIRVPTYRIHNFTYKGNPWVSGPLPARRFEAHLRDMDTGALVYRECDEVTVERPAAPRLTNDEWQDAVARFQEFRKGDHETYRSWVEADMEFLRRHDGATVVMHRSGNLVGAFYPAPSWDTSEDCVHFWSAVRRTMEMEP